MLLNFLLKRKEYKLEMLEEFEEELEKESEKEHPFILNDKWIFKYREYLDNIKGQTSVRWIDSFKLINEIEDLITFWKINNNIIYEDTIYSLFKEGIDPLWEHPKNIKGFSLHYYKKTIDDFNKFQIDISIYLLGASIPYYNDINGITFDVTRKKITIWFGISKTVKIINEINEFLNIIPDKTEDHVTSESLNHDNRNNFKSRTNTNRRNRSQSSFAKGNRNHNQRSLNNT